LKTKNVSFKNAMRIRLTNIHSTVRFLDKSVEEITAKDEKKKNTFPKWLRLTRKTSEETDGPVPTFLGCAVAGATGAGAMLILYSYSGEIAWLAIATSKKAREALSVWLTAAKGPTLP
jgi:hypothetical protein